MTAQSHRSAPRTLDRRTLQRDHRYLATLLRSGLSVLDVGCGTGAITSGVAKAVGPKGRVVGVDRDAVLLELACEEYGAIPNLSFERGDAATLAFRSEFDIVTAARTLQWIPEHGTAISKMKQAVKPTGMLVVLDYSHTRNQWEPDPPDEFKRFYRAFLDWRQANHWDNEIAAHLPELFRSAGLADIQSHVQDEIVVRGDPDFPERTALWTETIESAGEQLSEAGLCTRLELQAARDGYAAWVKTELKRQTLWMRTVTGSVV